LHHNGEGSSPIPIEAVDPVRRIGFSALPMLTRAQSAFEALLDRAMPRRGRTRRPRTAKTGKPKTEKNKR